jgi:hypothetical protein
MAGSKPKAKRRPKKAVKTERRPGYMIFGVEIPTKFDEAINIVAFRREISTNRSTIIREIFLNWWNGLPEDIKTEATAKAETKLKETLARLGAVPELPANN